MKSSPDPRLVEPRNSHPYDVPIEDPLGDSDEEELQLKTATPEEELDPESA